MYPKPAYPSISRDHLRKALRSVDNLNDEIIRLGLSKLVEACVDDESGKIPRIYVKNHLDYMEQAIAYIKPFRTLVALKKLPVGATEDDFWGAIVRT